jgi:hypothetical protein
MSEKAGLLPRTLDMLILKAPLDRKRLREERDNWTRLAMAIQAMLEA